MFTRQFLVFCLSAILFLVSFTCPVAAGEQPADVRLVLDVSGSMKANDPNNLRQPAVDLLVRLLPEQSKAGVWTFGKFVNMLVKHGVVDEEWKKKASNNAQKINSVGLYTNIGEALEKATYDHVKADDNFNKSVIILTDGMVDIDKDPQKNQQEWRRIIDDILPKLKKSGFTVHTVALSDNADEDLLNKLSLATDGIAATAHSADDLMQFFLQAFDAAAPTQQLPLAKDNSFVVDSSVEEFTALIFRRDNNEMTQIIGPDNAAFDASSAPTGVAWYRADNYDLITVKQPLEGSWTALVEMAPGSRISVMSNLALRVEPLPNNVKHGSRIDVRFLLQENGNTIKRPEFLSLMKYYLELRFGENVDTLKPIWEHSIDSHVPPDDGIYKVDMPKIERTGTYELTLKVDGKSFSRQFKHRFTGRHPFSARLKKHQAENGGVSYSLIVRSNTSAVDFSKTQVVATVYPPDNRKTVLTLSLTPQDSWSAPMSLTQKGTYRVKVKVDGTLVDGSQFSNLLDPLTIEYDPSAAFEAEAEELQVKKPKDEDKYLQPTSINSPTPALPEKEEPKTELEKQEEAKVNAEAANPEPAPEPESAVPSWALYSILGFGNVLLIGLGYFAYRKIMGSSQEDEAIEEPTEETEAPPAEAVKADEPEMEITDSDDEEPPMEDLGLGDEEEPEPQAEPDDDDIDIESLIDGADSEPTPDLEPQPKSEPEPTVDPQAKVPGLDIPESELDDAISDLIEELGGDDDGASDSDDEINLDDFDFDDDD